MPNKMLIDASHPEETRVVVVRGNRIEEFDFESQDKKQLKGNIYLARVTRVEPSLQAAFVEYGGNRHGFLAFSEIHPDYYQIPVADRQALLRAEAEEAEDEDNDDSEGDGRHERDRGRRGRRRGGKGRDHRREAGAAGAEENGESNGDAVTEYGESASADADNPAKLHDGDDNVSENGSSDIEAGSSDVASVSSEVEAGTAEVEAVAPDADAVSSEDEAGSADAKTASADEAEAPSSEGVSRSLAASVEADVISEEASEQATEATSDDNDRGMLEEVHHAHGDDHEIESVGAEDALEEVRNRRKPARRQYQIQEVIKRRQILLVQVVKEERGNKGAALTTYLSLAGRYSVLMPNTARGGGISRKITNAQDRKRLKEVVADLEVPQGMGVILRTAGESRTKAEIKRDYEYLMRLWENVRSLTLESTAPALVYEEGSLIKRSVRDLYNKDIDEVLVSGEEGYREAKDFMRMLMPSHARVVQPYRDTTPIFVRSGIEAQLDRMLQPQVTLKSGGYIIINQTEALVAIDVNSGRSTKEHSIEDTALHTNLEAAEEVARQLRLRDLAGLIVIDFIDMEENRNNRAVEKRLKDHLKNDRARIQVGRISHFGLMEMSRQRIRASVLESTMKPCPQCGGTGHVRSDSSEALLLVRAVEEFLLKDSKHHIIVRTPAANALYILNHKRGTLVELERRFGLTITIEADESVGSQHYTILRGAVAEKPIGFVEARTIPVYEDDQDDPEIPLDEEDEDEVSAGSDDDAPRQAQQPQPHARSSEEGDGHDRKRRKRRRRRGGKDREHGDAAAHGSDASTATDGDGDATGDDIDNGEQHDDAPVAVAEAADEGQVKKRRRGKRGGRRNRPDEGGSEAAADQGDANGEDGQGAADEGAEATVASQPDTAAEVLPETAEPAEIGVPADVPPANVAPADAAAADVEATDVTAEALPAVDDAPVEEKPKRARRVARPKKTAEAPAEADAATEAPAVEQPGASEEAPAPAEKKPAKPRASRRKVVAEEAPAEAVAAEEAPAEPVLAEAPAEEQAAPSVEAEPVQPVEEKAEEPVEEKPKRSGWWQRKGFF